MNSKPASIQVYQQQEREALDVMHERMVNLIHVVQNVDPDAQISFIDDEILIECSEETRARIVEELCK